MFDELTTIASLLLLNDLYEATTRRIHMFKLMFTLMWDVKEPTHYSKRVVREVLSVVAVPRVVNTGPMLLAVSLSEMVILYKYVKIIIKIIVIIIITIIIYFTP